MFKAAFGRGQGMGLPECKRGLDSSCGGSRVGDTSSKTILPGCHWRFGNGVDGGERHGYEQQVHSNDEKATKQVWV